MRVNVVRHILPTFVYLHKCLYCLVEVNLSGNTFNLSLKFDYTVPEIPPAIRDSGVFIGANRLSYFRACEKKTLISITRQYPQSRSAIHRMMFTSFGY